MGLCIKIFGSEQILTEKKQRERVIFIATASTQGLLLVLQMRDSQKKRAVGNFTWSSDCKRSFTDKNGRNSS